MFVVNSLILFQLLLEHIEETDEDHTLIVLSGNKFLELVQCSKQVISE